MCQFMKQLKDICVIFVIDTIDQANLVATIKERLEVKAFTIEIINFEGDDIES